MRNFTSSARHVTMTDLARSPGVPDATRADSMLAPHNRRCLVWLCRDARFQDRRAGRRRQD